MGNSNIKLDNNHIIFYYEPNCVFCNKAKKLLSTFITNGAVIVKSSNDAPKEVTGFPYFINPSNGNNYIGLPPSSTELFKQLNIDQRLRGGVVDRKGNTVDPDNETSIAVDQLVRHIASTDSYNTMIEKENITNHLSHNLSTTKYINTMNTITLSLCNTAMACYWAEKELNDSLATYYIFRSSKTLENAELVEKEFGMSIVSFEKLYNHRWYQVRYVKGQITAPGYIERTQFRAFVAASQYFVLISEECINKAVKNIDTILAKSIKAMKIYYRQRVRLKDYMKHNFLHGFERKYNEEWNKMIWLADRITKHADDADKERFDEEKHTFLTNMDSLTGN